jgi:hypothetical protein
VLPGQLPRPGDQLEVTAELSRGREAYLYVIVFFSNEKEGHVLCPDRTTGSRELRAKLYQPSPGSLLPIPKGNGVVAVVLGARSKPLDAEALTAFTAGHYQWPSPRRTENFPAEASAEAERPAHMVVRGTGDQDRFDFPAGMRKTDLDSLFETYYAVMFSWFDKSTDSSARLDTDRELPLR